MRASLMTAMVVAVTAGCATAQVPETPTELAEPVLRLVDITPTDGSRVDSSTVIEARLTYQIPNFDPDARYAISAVFAGPDGRMFNRGGGFSELRSPAGIATVRHSLEDLWTAQEDVSVAPLTGTFFLLKHDLPARPVDTPGAGPETHAHTAVVVSPIQARTRTFYFNGAGPARSLATELPDALEEYFTYRPHKAFAMAHDGSSGWTYGYAYGFPSVDEAAEVALEHCRTAAERREVDAPCRIIALDDQSVEP